MRTGNGNGSAVTHHGVHAALFYRDTTEFLAGVLRFVVDGLDAGEPVLIALPTEHLALLRTELGADTAATMVDIREAGHNPGRIIPGVLYGFADAFPDRPVRIVLESTWPHRSEMAYPACAQQEALINLAFHELPVSILCPVSVAGLEPVVLADMARAHPVIADADRRLPSPTYAPDQVIADYNLPLPEPADAQCSVVDARGLSTLRHTVKDAAARFGFDEQRQVDFVLAVTELATNGIEHGGGTATVAVAADDNHLVAWVHDGGQLTDPLAGRRPAGPDQPRGRGLLMVNQLASLVRRHLTPSGTTMMIRFDRTVPAQPNPSRANPRRRAARDNTGHADRDCADQNRVEQSLAEPNLVEPNRVEPNRVERNRAEPNLGGANLGELADA
jgi:anti-sigma regulatory factor (Ser/Thr protein kinase)